MVIGAAAGYCDRECSSLLSGLVESARFEAKKRIDLITTPIPRPLPSVVSIRPSTAGLDTVSTPTRPSAQGYSTTEGRGEEELNGDFSDVDREISGRCWRLLG